MKATEKRTDYILVKASADDAFTNCDYAVIFMDEQMIAELDEKVQIAESFSGTLGFRRASFYTDNVRFCMDSENGVIDEILQEKDWTYIEVEADEVYSLPKAEDKIVGTELHIGTSGYVFFTGYGGYTGDKFHTLELPVYEIMEVE